MEQVFAVVLNHSSCYHGNHGVTKLTSAYCKSETLHTNLVRKGFNNSWCMSAVHRCFCILLASLVEVSIMLRIVFQDDILRGLFWS